MVAIWREGRPHRAWLAEMPLQHGDALLLQGSRDGIAHHPASMMVMGPGGYRYRDYARLGTPLTLLLCAVLLATVLLFWSF